MEAVRVFSYLYFLLRERRQHILQIRPPSDKLWLTSWVYIVLLTHLTQRREIDERQEWWDVTVHSTGRNPVKIEQLHVIVDLLDVSVNRIIPNRAAQRLAHTRYTCFSIFVRLSFLKYKLRRTSRVVLRGFFNTKWRIILGRFIL